MVRLLRTSAALGLALGGAVGVSGCLLESHAPSDLVPLGGFCQEFFDALCGPIEACACAEVTSSDCRAEQHDLCVGFPSPAMRAAIEEGRLTYDGSAAARLLARMRERQERCEGFVDALDWRVRDLFSLGEVFHGTVGVGEPCSALGFELISECALGSCAPTGEGPVCRGAVGLGDRCDPTHQCVDLDAELTADRGIDRLTLRCVSDGADPAVGTCASWVEAGGACASDADCWSGRCDDERCVSLPGGSSCLSSRECASGYCRPSDRTCRPGDAPVGARCEGDRACASHVCVGGVCRGEACGTF